MTERDKGSSGESPPSQEHAKSIQTGARTVKAWSATGAIASREGRSPCGLTSSYRSSGAD